MRPRPEMPSERASEPPCWLRSRTAPLERYYDFPGAAVSPIWCFIRRTWLARTSLGNNPAAGHPVSGVSNGHRPGDQRPDGRPNSATAQHTPGRRLPGRRHVRHGCHNDRPADPAERRCQANPEHSLLPRRARPGASCVVVFVGSLWLATRMAGATATRPACRRVGRPTSRCPGRSPSTFRSRCWARPAGDVRYRRRPEASRS